MRIITKILGKNEIFVFERIGSSNQEAILKALDNAKDGTLIIAENQEKGRGTKNHTWFSAPRSLQFSLILRSVGRDFEIKPIIQSTLLCISLTIKEYCKLDATIKSPNDIMINNKKVAGVLVETGYRGEDLEWLILGIGINVNASQNDFPVELQDICTSIYAESNTFHDRNNLFAHFLNKLEKMLFNPPRKQ